MLMKGLVEDGQSCTLFTPLGSRSEKMAQTEGIPFLPVKLTGSLDWVGIMALRKALIRGGFDVLHLHSNEAIMQGALASIGLKIKVVATRRRDKPLDKGFSARIVLRRLIDMHVGVSPNIMQHYFNYKIPDEKTKLICSVLDEARLKSTKPREVVRGDFRATPTTPVIMCMGHLHHRKGIDVLLAAVAKLRKERRKFLLWVVGSGPEETALERLCKSYDLRGKVLFLGKHENPADLLHACDIFVMPSRKDGMGTIAMEAMACGRAVVASNVGGLSYSIVDGSTGILVPPEDADQLAEALDRLIHDPDLRTEMGEAAQWRMDEYFMPDTMVEQYLHVYQGLLGS